MDRDFEIAHREEMLVLLLGTNMGNRAKNLTAAIAGLSALFGQPLSQSAVYETPPWGNENQAPFLNLAVIHNTRMKPTVLLDSILQLELDLGRVRQEKWGPRLIDIDIIFYGNMIYQSDFLEIPHPYMHERQFVLEPLNEIIPSFEHPLLGKNVSQLFREVSENVK